MTARKRPRRVVEEELPDDEAESTEEETAEEATTETTEEETAEGDDTADKSSRTSTLYTYDRDEGRGGDTNRMK